MWYSSVSFILVIAICMQCIQGVLLITISFNTEKLSDNVGLSFGEPMDTCDDPNNQNTVRLNGTGLSNVGKDFVSSADVQYITLENNKIFDFSIDAFKSVPNLSCLNIRKNQIKLSNLPTLRHHNLAKLNLADNQLKFTSKMQWNLSLPSLTHLDLSDNNINALPSETVFQDSLPSLTHFYFSGNSFSGNIFRYLPRSTVHFYLGRSTATVDLSNVPLHLSALFINENSVYTDSYNTLTNLRILSMRKCRNAENFRGRILPNLVDLDLSSNNLRSINEYMFNGIKSLQRLSLENNALSSFTALNEFHLLTDLSLNFNNIETITAQTIGNLTNLRRLHLRANRISLIEGNAFSQLRLLEKLDLSMNKLTVLPTMWKYSLRALSHLNLTSNLFTTVDDMSVSYPSPLNNLYIGKNNFTRFKMSSLDRINSHVIIHIL